MGPEFRSSAPIEKSQAQWLCLSSQHREGGKRKIPGAGGCEPHDKKSRDKAGRASLRGPRPVQRPRRAGPRPFPDLTAARCRGAGGPHSPRPTPGTRLRELPLLRQSRVGSERASTRAAAAFGTPQRASEACRAGRVKARPACQAATAAQPSSAPDAVRPPRHGPGAASPALALAAEQHGARRLVLRGRDARRRSPRIGRTAVRVGSKQNPPPSQGSPPRGGAEVGGGLPGARTGPLTSALALSARGRPEAVPTPGSGAGAARWPEPEWRSSPFPLQPLTSPPPTTSPLSAREWGSLFHPSLS
ncbi:translation initiation factor IF-2-like [Peromyscus californicus insignis]|uniref:translation initiation factor IF-2-like n=1 Tax=Peromyscus californicus insignis TaxID=564181 RepID=UPI0022A6D054|nr:translation initiation factor IF-2-like [Peromyscus californicus insignis]